MNNTENNGQKTIVSGGITFNGLLQILFIALKLTGFISWNWFLVLLPTLIPVGIVLLGLFIGGSIYLLGMVLESIDKSENRRL